MTAVPAGTYTMGCTPGQQPCGANNAAHPVTVDSFHISAFEITQAQYQAV